MKRPPHDPDESKEPARYSLRSWRDLPVYQKPTRLRFVADLANIAIFFAVGAAAGGFIGFVLWDRALEMVSPAWARSLFVGKVFVGGGALLGGLWSASKRTTLG